MGNLILTMVAKICITMAFICFALLVELDGSPDVDPGMEGASPVPAIGEAEEGPADDVEDEAIPEDDEDDDVPKPKPRSALLPDGPPPSNLQGGYNGEEVVSEDDEDDDVPKPKPRSAPVPPSNLQGGYNDEEAVPEDDGEEVPPKPRSAVPKESARRPPGSPRNIGGGGYRSKPAPKKQSRKEARWQRKTNSSNHRSKTMHRRKKMCYKCRRKRPARRFFWSLVECLPSISIVCSS